MVHQYTIAHFSTWISLLFRHGVSRSKIPRAILISIITFLLIPIHLLNHLIFLNKKRKITNTKDPVFIIGHWRSGTTYLQYLMGKDEQFGYLTYYQAFMPTLVWAGGTFLKRILASGMPEKRPQDNVYLESDLPTEEENPLATMSLYSASHSFFFPQSESYYDRFILFKNINKKEKRKWQRAYQFMLRNIQARFPDRQLLIKNPHNTGRVKELLEIYPNAKFIFLTRSAFEVIPSTIRMYDKVVSQQYLQSYTPSETEDKIFYYHQSIIQRYLDAKSSVPKNQLIEIRYEELLDHSNRTIEKIYDQLEFNLSESSRKSMHGFIEENKKYRSNQHHISDILRQRIEEELGWFEKYRNDLILK